MTCRAWDTLGTQDLCLSFTRLSEYSAERGGHRQRSSAARRMGTQQYQSIAYFELGQGAAAAQLGHGPVSTYGYGVSQAPLFFFRRTPREYCACGLKKPLMTPPLLHVKLKLLSH